jgi:hypothetical protein
MRALFCVMTDNHSSEESQALPEPQTGLSSAKPASKDSHEWVSASVEILAFNWSRYVSIERLTFEPGSRLRKVSEDSFLCSARLISVSLPMSVEIVRGFNLCPNLRDVFFEASCRLRELDGFQGCTCLSRVQIPASVEDIGYLVFSGCSGLHEVAFAAGGRLRRICGFHGCLSLRRIEIPASVEVVASAGFFGCLALEEVAFAAGGRLIEVCGFGSCASVPRVEIPASVEFVGGFASTGCSALEEVAFAARSRLSEIHGFKSCARLCRIGVPTSVAAITSAAFAESRPGLKLTMAAGTWIGGARPSGGFRAFVAYEGERDVRKRRRWLHLGTLGFVATAAGGRDRESLASLSYAFEIVCGSDLWLKGDGSKTKGIP